MHVAKLTLSLFFFPLLTLEELFGDQLGAGVKGDELFHLFLKVFQMVVALYLELVNGHAWQMQQKCCEHKHRRATLVVG